MADKPNVHVAKTALHASNTSLDIAIKVVGGVPPAAWTAENLATLRDALVKARDFNSTVAQYLDSQN